MTHEDRLNFYKTKKIAGEQFKICNIFHRLISPKISEIQTDV